MQAVSTKSQTVSIKSQAASGVIHGVARLDRRTKNLIPRLRPGEIAILDHQDLDGLSASGLIERRPAAVMNVSPSISGRYPNRGPSMLLNAGIPVMDLADRSAFGSVRDGQTVEVESEGLRCDGKLYPGAWLSNEDVEHALEEARRFLGSELEAFARNTLEYIERERHLVVDAPDVPDLKTVLGGRHAVVVVRGEGFKRDLEAILPYIHEVRPVLIAVDGAADALLENHLRPDLVVGDMDSISDRALLSGSEIVVHSYPRGWKKGAIPDSAPDDEEMAPGLARLKKLGLEGKVFSVAGTSEDMAMLMAYEKGAELIVAVGTHFSLVDFLDKGRSGMASTFLVRLRVGSRLVDARGVGALYGVGPGFAYAWWYLLAAASIPTLALSMLSPGLRAWLSVHWTLFSQWLHRY